MTQKLICWTFAGWSGHCWHWYEFKVLVIDDGSEAHFSVLQLISYLTYFFFYPPPLVRLTPESDASETALIEQSGFKCAANLQALPELFNCDIYRSVAESFILSVTLLPGCPSPCVYFESCYPSWQFLAASVDRFVPRSLGILQNEAEQKKATGFSGVKLKCFSTSHSVRVHVLEWHTHTHAQHT